MGFIGTLLNGTAAIWFSSLCERYNPLMFNLEEFLSEVKETFGDLDKATAAANQIRNLSKGKTSQNMSQRLRLGRARPIGPIQERAARRGQRLLVTLPIPKNMHVVIRIVVACDNRIIERKGEKCCV